MPCDALSDGCARTIARLPWIRPRCGWRKRATARCVSPVLSSLPPHYQPPTSTISSYMSEYSMQLPDLTTFLDSPRADVAALAPQTAIVSVNGTRRSAALAGVTPHTGSYAEWSLQGMLAYMDLLVGHGIRNVFAAAVIAPNMIEFAHYRERFLGWIAHGLAGQHALADYARRGWRVRISGADAIPELQN